MVLLIRAALVAGVHQNHPVAACVEDVPHIGRHQSFGDGPAQKLFVAEHLVHAVHRRHLIGKLGELPVGEVFIHDHEMGGGHVEVVLQAVGAHNAVHGLGQAVEQGVVDVHLVLGNGEGNHQNQKADQQRQVVLGHKLCRAGQLGDQGAVVELLNGLAELHQQGRKHRNGAHNAQRNALGHHDADVRAQGQAHGAHGQEARDGGEGRSRNGRGRVADGPGHALFQLGVGEVRAAQVGLFFLKAVQQEDGEVHGHAQLKHRGQRLGDVADLAQEDVGAEVVGNGERQPQHKDEGHHRALQAEEQHHQRAAHRAQHVQRDLLVDQGLGVRQNGGHTADEAILAQDRLDLLNGGHGLGAGAGALKLHQQHGCAAVVVEKVPHIGRKHLAGNGHVQHIAGPYHLAHARHLGKFVLHLQGLGGGQVFHRKHGRTGHVEVVLQIGLTDHGVQLCRKIGQNVVIDVGADRAQQRRNKQQHCHKQHQPPVANHEPGKSFHGVLSFQNDRWSLLSHSVYEFCYANAIVKMTNSHFYVKLTLGYFSSTWHLALVNPH